MDELSTEAPPAEQEAGTVAAEGDPTCHIFLLGRTTKPSGVRSIAFPARETESPRWPARKP